MTGVKIRAVTPLVYTSFKHFMSEVQQNPAERISVAHINNHMLKHPLLSSDGICLVRKDYGK